jgi:serine/threonine protein kinase
MNNETKTNLDDTNRNPMDVLAEQFTNECREGLRPSVEEYAEQHPQLAEKIRDLFPSIQAIEQLGSHTASEKRFAKANAVFDRNKIEQIGDYRIVREIGRGGMGIVYEAIQQSLGRHVAIKLLLQTSTDPKHLQRFEREARTAANLHHTNIVPVFGVGNQEGYHYYVMQLIDGIGLDRVIQDMRDSDDKSKTKQNFRTRLAVSPGFEDVARIGGNVAEALQYAHDQGTLHRDIKPANLLLDDEGSVWVADFGLAKAMEDGNVSRTGEVIGTLRFMAPEQFAGHPDPRSDVYSLGLTIYELLTLKPAYDETSRSHLLSGANSTSFGFEAPSKLDPAIPRDLETIVMKACAREPDDRYQTAGDLAFDLENFLEGRPIMARPPSTLETFVKWCRRNPAIASLTGLAALLLTLVAISTSIGYVKTNKALNWAREERTRTEIEKRLVELEKQKAEQTLGISLQALDKVYKRFAPDRMSQTANDTMEGIDGEQLTISSQPMLSKETASLLEDVLSFYDRFAQQDTENLLLKKEAAKANRRVGDIHRQLGDHEKSTIAYLNAIAMYMQIGDSELELAKIETALGDVHRKSNEHRSARQSFLNAIDLLEPLVAENSGAGEAKFELARTLYLLSKPRLHNPEQHIKRGSSGSPRGERSAPADRPPPPRPGERRGGPERRGDPDRPGGPGMNPEDIVYLERAVTLLENLNLNDSAHPEYRFLLALCYREKDKLVLGNDDKQSIALLEKLCSQYPQVPEYQFELGVTLADVPVHNFRDARIEDSIDGLRLSLQQLNSLTREHPNIPRYIESCAHTHHKLGTLLRKSADESPTRRSATLRAANIADSQRHLRMAVRLQTTQCEQFPESISEKIWLARMRDNLAISLLLGKQPDEALSLIELAIAESSSIATEEGDRVPSIHILIGQYETQADIYDYLGRQDDAEASRREANDLREYLPPRRPRGDDKPRGGRR